MLDFSQGQTAPPVYPAAKRGVRNNVKSVRHGEGHERNLSRYASKWSAANILKNHDAALSKRISHCGYVARQFEVTLERKGDTGKAGFDGLKTCASVWCCPCCSPGSARGERMNWTCSCLVPGLLVMRL